MPAEIEVLHYTGGDDDRGGIVSIVRNLATTGRFRCVLGLNAGASQERQPALPALTLSRLAGELISPANFWRARRVATAVQAWLAGAPGRVFHGHSRAGLLVGLWLRWRGEQRVVVSVHCYGRQRWFYRWAAGELGAALYWLSPAMKRYYGVGDGGWSQCRPGCGPTDRSAPLRAPRAGAVLHLGGIGALVRWKRWDLVLAALRALPVETQRRIRFSHLGAGDGSAESAAYAAELRATATGLATEVAWLGQQPSSGPFLSQIDLLVVASHDEPFSVAMLEALQAGVPVIAADTGGAQDAIAPGVSGWLFRSGDAAALARRLDAVIAGEVLAGSGRVAPGLEGFALTTAAADWEAIYRRVITEPVRT